MFYYIDLFCGAGGVTTGIERAMFEGQKCAQVIACVNHDPHAIASHLANHPECVHFTEDIRTLNVSPIVDLVRKVREQDDAIIVLWASCECTNYSKAKGGQARDADSRTLPEHLFRYIEAIDPDYIQMENVEEFMCWGDLDENGHPVSRDRGRLYLRWVNKVKKYGYVYDYRILNAADYGAYTSRRRYFGVFAKKSLPIAFPEPTHARKPQDGLFGRLKPWKPVREVLCLEDEGVSIFARSKPLCDATLKRIMAGLEKFVVRNDGKTQTPNETKPRFLMKNFSGDDKSKCISIEQPAGTVTCKDHHSFVTVYNGNGNNVSIDEPAPTLTTKDRLGIVHVARFLDQQYGQGTPTSISRPCSTITAVPKQSLVSVYLMNPQYGWPVYDTERPCPTIIARQDKRPMYAIFTQNGPSYLEESEGDSETMRSMKAFCRKYGIADIKMRMLRIDELLSIMGFPRNYALLGTKSENKKYIGNAVECGISKQLCEALYAAHNDNSRLYVR